MTGRKYKLLLVDDNPEICDAYETLLPSHNFTVESARTYEAGLKKLKATRYDIILLDMRLPDGTGEDLFMELQNNLECEINRETPVAIFTGYPDDKTRGRLLDLGVVAYLIKPFDTKALASVLDNLMEIERRKRQNLKLTRQLEDIQRFNDLVFNTLPSGLIILDVDDKIVLANIAAHSILDFPADELIGMNLPSIVGEEEFQHIISQVDNSHSENREIEIELENFTLTIGFTIATLTNREEKNIGKILIFRDITTIKALAEETKRVERLASMGTLASGIAHEVKNPLAGIKAMAQVLEGATTEDPQLSSYSRRIIGQVDRLNGLLNSFFSIARAKKSERRIFPLDSVFREVIPLVSGTAKKRMIEIELQAPEDVEVFARPDQLQQVLLNLILNAIEASPSKSRVCIEVDPPVEKSVKRPIFGEHRAPDRPFMQTANSVVIRIVDNGPGIAKEQVQRIFDPFYTTKEQGTGLGLFIVHQLVKDELGGQIDVLSKNGETVFAFILPTLPMTIVAEPSPLDLPGTPGFMETDNS